MKKLIRFLQHLRSTQSVNVSLSRGAAGLAGRQIDERRPQTWEFSGFSQNGEDGIIDVLSRHILRPNRYFIEVGASNGLENNTTWLALTHRWSGLWIEGSQASSDWCRYLFTPLCFGAEPQQMFVTRENAPQVLEAALRPDPDVFSLDIDGNDYYVAQALLLAGLRPKVFIVEYNSAFGPERAVTIPYQEDFRVGEGHAQDLYFGCSVAAWKLLLKRWGYTFVTVDQNGVNAFFVDASHFEPGFVEGIEPLEFAENFCQARRYRGGWQKQWPLISGRALQQVQEEAEELGGTE